MIELTQNQIRRTRSRLVQLTERSSFDLKLALDAAAMIEIAPGLKARLLRARNELEQAKREMQKMRTNEQKGFEK